ncbi:hypothetical protein DRO59_09630 [Candidatus Bathyarchaeota archaeon]|nr:MAG: hypothetical protein DRO59_09630 [Candidatus Bathyarchaeota archaeon]
MAPSLITLFRDLGVNSAIIKYTAQYKSENKTADIKGILVSGLLFELVMGFSPLSSHFAIRLPSNKHFQPS